MNFTHFHTWITLFGVNHAFSHDIVRSIGRRQHARKIEKYNKSPNKNKQQWLSIVFRYIWHAFLDSSRLHGHQTCKLRLSCSFSPTVSVEVVRLSSVTFLFLLAPPAAPTMSLYGCPPGIAQLTTTISDDGQLSPVPPPAGPSYGLLQKMQYSWPFLQATMASWCPVPPPAGPSWIWIRAPNSGYRINTTFPIRKTSDNKPRHCIFSRWYEHWTFSQGACIIFQWTFVCPAHLIVRALMLETEGGMSLDGDTAADLGGGRGRCGENSLTPWTD